MNSLITKLISFFLTITLICVVLPLSMGEDSLPQPKDGRRSRGNTIIVNASGEGNFVAIQAAIDNAEDGDTIYVEAGTYIESLIIDKRINLTGAGKDKTTIDGGSNGNVITITKDSVIISGFTIKNSGVSHSSAGIKISHANYCKIENNSCENNNANGIYLYVANENKIINNSCNLNKKSGIFLSDSHRNSIYHNDCHSNWYDGIDICSSWNNNITDNEINNNLIWGIDIAYSSNNYLENNYCYSNNRDGIYIQDGSNNNLTANICNSNGWNGIYIWGPVEYSNQNFISNNICILNSLHGIALINVTNNNQIINNTLYSNTLHGINIGEEPRNNVIHHNNFIFNNNNGTQASDDGTNNDWDDGVEGNYWSNWTTPDTNENGIVDVPYNLSGSANAQDHFPLVNPISELLIIANAGNDVTIDKHQTVTFDGTNSWGYPAIANYTWTFNYNSTPVFLYGSTPSFTFHSPGTYVVTLTVKNESGNSDSDRMIVFVRDVEPPLDLEPPIANAGADKTIHQGETFIFNGSGSSDNVGIINYTWNFSYNNNSVILYGISPRFTFDIPGIYNVTLNVSDAKGNWAADVIKITVRNANEPIARAGEDVTVDQHENVHFDGSSSTDDVGIVNYTWNFAYDDLEIFLYGATADFKFDDAGAFAVALNVTDGDGYRDSDTLLVTVGDITPPVADAGPDIAVDQHRTVFFDPSGSSDNVGITSYIWSFTYDGSPIVLNGENSSFTFHDAGSYVIILNITDANGNWATDSLNVTVRDIASPIAEAGTNITITQGERAFFDGSKSFDNVGISNYTWNFSYNSTNVKLRGMNASFIFNVPGIYIVTLTVSDLEGNTASDTLPVTVLKEKEDDDPLSPDIEKDSDGDGYNDTYENASGSDPYNPKSTPLDLDGDGVSNEKDAFPNDSDRWVSEGRDEESETAVYVWIGIVIFIITVGGVILYISKTKKEKEVEQSSEDDLGRVDKGEMEESE